MKKFEVLGTVSINRIGITVQNPISFKLTGKRLDGIGIPDNCASINTAIFEKEIKKSFVEYYCSKEVVPFTAVLEEQQIHNLKTQNSGYWEILLRLFNEHPENQLKFIKTPFSINILNDIQKKLCDIKDETGKSIYKYFGTYIGSKYGL